MGYAPPSRRQRAGSSPLVRPRRGRCETYIIDVPTAFIAGSLLAFAARRLLVARRPDPYAAGFGASLLFAAVYAVGVGWAAWQAPDWMLNYFLPVEELPLPLPLLHALFVLCCLLGAAAGHVLTATCLQRGWTGRAVLVLLSGVVVLFGLWGITLDSYLHVGSWAEYRAGTAVLLPESHIALGFNLLGVLFAFTFAVPAVLLYRGGQRIRAT